MAKVKVTDSVSQWVTRSPIELFWTAKNHDGLILFCWNKRLKTNVGCLVSAPSSTFTEQLIEKLNRWFEKVFSKKHYLWKRNSRRKSRSWSWINYASSAIRCFSHPSIFHNRNLKSFIKFCQNSSWLCPFALRELRSWEVASKAY